MSGKLTKIRGATDGRAAIPLDQRRSASKATAATIDVTPHHASQSDMKLRLSISTAIIAFGLLLAVGFASVVLTGTYALR